MNKRKVVAWIASAITFLSLGAMTQKASADIVIKNNIKQGAFAVAVANSAGDNYGDTDIKYVDAQSTKTWWRNSKEGALLNVGEDMFFVSSSFAGHIDGSPGNYNLYSAMTGQKVPAIAIDEIFGYYPYEWTTVINESHDGTEWYDVTLSKFGMWDGENDGDATNGAKFSLYAPWFSSQLNSHSWRRRDNNGGTVLGVDHRYYYVHAGDDIILKNGGIPYFRNGSQVEEVYMQP